jgi:hypothetical protein
MRVSLLFGLICLVGLGGCSFRFDVQAVMIDGRLAFVPGGRSSKPECISQVVVRDEAAPTAESYAAWMEAAYVWVDLGGYQCTDRFPLFYGEPLKGEDPDRTGDFREVSPKALRVGAIYEVMVIAGGSGSGGGRFRLLPDGRVENLGRPMLIGEDAPLVTTPE